MTAHEAPVSQTVEWYTPPEVFARLDMDFDLDPASPIGGLAWIPANRYYSIHDDGTRAEWRGAVWLNPPYGPSCPLFVDRMIEHGNGVMLVAGRTETRWFQRAAMAADLVAFARDRIHFIRQDGLQARSSFASVFMAFGDRAASHLGRADFGWTPR